MSDSNQTTTPEECHATKQDKLQVLKIKSRIITKKIRIEQLLNVLTFIPAPVCKIITNYSFYDPKIIDVILGLTETVEVSTPDKMWQMDLDVIRCEDIDRASQFIYRLDDPCKGPSHIILEIYSVEKKIGLSFKKLYDMFWNTNYLYMGLQNEIYDVFNQTLTLEHIRNNIVLPLFQTLAKALEAKIQLNR